MKCSRYVIIIIIMRREEEEEEEEEQNSEKLQLKQGLSGTHFKY